VFTEYHTLEILTAKERILWNALKFGTTGEVDSTERVALAEGLPAVPPNYSEIGTHQGELNEAIGDALVVNTLPQRLRTKLIFDVRIEDDFLD